MNVIVCQCTVGAPQEVLQQNKEEALQELFSFGFPKESVAVLNPTIKDSDSKLCDYLVLVQVVDLIVFASGWEDSVLCRAVYEKAKELGTSRLTVYRTGESILLLDKKV